MQIKVVSVEVNKVPGKKYNMIEVAYKNDKGELKGRKVMSFGVKKGLDILTGAVKDDILDIELVKEGDYWNWVGIAKGVEGTSTAPTSTSSNKEGSYSNRNYESKEERAVRQKLIVRQSSLSNAIAILKTDKVVPDTDSVIRLAEKLEAFVFGVNAEVAAPQGAETEAEVE